MFRRKSKNSVQINLSMNEAVELMLLLDAVRKIINSAEGNVKGKDTTVKLFDNIYSTLEKQMPPEVNIFTEFSGKLTEAIVKEQDNG